MKYLSVFLVCVFSIGLLRGQSSQLPDDPARKLHDLNERLLEQAKTTGGNPESDRQDYQIGTEDLLDISVFEVPELSRTVRVSASGEISLPLVGSLKVAGLSPLGLERALTDRLRDTVLKDPQVTIFLREFHSEPVSVVGAVKVPGLYHIQTKKSLLEILAMAQGFSEGPARLPGRDIVITRKPRSAAMLDAAAVQATSDGAEIVEIPVKQLLESGDPKWNVPIYPGDVIKVAPAGTIYVAGDVTRPGAFALTDFDNMSVIQAISMAGGTLKTAGKKESLVIRRDAAGNRVEQKVNLVRILEGKDTDLMLGPNDILFVPGSVGKTAALRALETAIQTGTGLLIWGRPF